MTVIAYRSGIMACDSCWTYGNTQTVSAIKIKRLKSGALLGGAGDNDSRSMEALLDTLKDPAKMPTREALAATKAEGMWLLALQRGGVWVVSTGRHDESGYPYRPDGEEGDDFGVWPATTMGGFAAIGSGGDCALAAMHAGASAKEAVEIACKLDINCRAPYHTIRLWAQKPTTGHRASKKR